jgi:alkylated DNA repair protein (DNA oxidative demethylase)
MQSELPFAARAREPVAIADGAVWLKHWLTVDEQRVVAEQCLAIMNGPVGGYVPTVRGGGKMHVRMVCLGRHWNALTYKYEPTRADYDDAPVLPVPEAWAQLASRAAAHAGFTFVPDLCIMNWYDAEGRMGLHQTKTRVASRSTQDYRSSRFRWGTRRGFCLEVSSGAIRFSRCCWNPVTRSYSAAPRVCATTGCLESFRAPRRGNSGSRDASTSHFGGIEDEEEDAAVLPRGVGRVGRIRADHS